MRKISKEEVLHIATLARLSISDKEVEVYREQLGRILGYIEKLNEVDTSDVEPTFYSFIRETPMREDIPEKRDSAEEAVQPSPDRSGNFFRVPKVIK